MLDPYAVDAAFYDALHADFRDDVGLWLSFAGRTDRPVLEIGCGTGRIATELAKAGHAVTGIDISPSMLARARARADEAGLEVEWIERSLLDVAFEEGRFGFVLVPQDVFLYCRDTDEQLAWLQAIAECLHFSGTVAIDLPGPALWLDPSSNGAPLLVYSGETDEGTPFDAWHVHEDDLALQERWLRVTYETTDETGLVRRRHSEHQLRYVYRFEMEHLLSLAGLTLADVFGDYDLGPLTNESERMVVIARRNET